MSKNKILMSLGYRQLDQDIWAKPIGYHIVSIDTKEMTISNIFSSMKDMSAQLYERKALTEERFESGIKEFEAYGKFTVRSGKQYAFLTIEQKTDLMFDGE